MNPVWWWDSGTDEVVRCRDGRRWDAHEIPELFESAHARRAVNMPVLDAWVLAQPEKE